MPQVYPAEPYRPGALHSLGRAEHMLLRQYKFPDRYSKNDQLISRFSDRLNPDELRSILQKHIGDHSDTDLETWFRSATHGRHMELLKDLLQADLATDWTGYRITASVGGNGHTLWFFELFAKCPEGDTVIYSNEQAPNILVGPRR